MEGCVWLQGGRFAECVCVKLSCVIASYPVHQIMFVYVLLSLLLSLSHYLVLYSATSRSLVEGVTMYSRLVTVLLLASAANGSGGQGAGGVGGGVGGNVDLHSFAPHRCTGARHKLHMYTT